MEAREQWAFSFLFKFYLYPSNFLKLCIDIIMGKQFLLENKLGRGRAWEKGEDRAHEQSLPFTSTKMSDQLLSLQLAHANERRDISKTETDILHSPLFPDLPHSSSKDYEGTDCGICFSLSCFTLWVLLHGLSVTGLCHHGRKPMDCLPPGETGEPLAL